MIMDHHQIAVKALESLRLKLHQNLNLFNLLPEIFTMKDVQELYETIFNKSFAGNSFQKMMLDLNVLERLEKNSTGAATKPHTCIGSKNEDCEDELFERTQE